MAEGQLASATETQTSLDTAPPVAKPGPGPEALRAMIASGQRPDPAAVVELIDAHRGERDAILAMLHATFGNGYVQEVMHAMDRLRLSVKNREIAAGDPSDPKGGYFVAGQAEQGARWRTEDGSFTGKANKDGLDTKYQVNEHDAVHGTIDKSGTGALAYEKDGVSQGELYGRVKGSENWEAGVRRTDAVGDGALTYGARHQVTANGANDGVSAEYKTTDGKTTAGGSLAVQDGHAVGDVHGTHKLENGGTISGNASVAQTPAGQVTTIAGGYADPTTNVNGSVVREPDRTTYNASATEQVTPALSLGGTLNHVAPDHGPGQTTLSLNDRYRTGNVVQGLDLSLGKGERDFASATGSIEGKLAPNLYAGAWGTYTTESGKHDSGSIGASLTFTPSEKTALTLAGIVDTSGALETRLQLDVFKQKIESLGELSSHKKDALVSLFVSYTQGGSRGMLDDRFGAPQRGFGGAAGEGQVNAGIRIKF